MCERETQGEGGRHDSDQQGWGVRGLGQRWLGGLSQFIRTAINTCKHTWALTHFPPTVSSPHLASDSQTRSFPCSYTRSHASTQSTHKTLAPASHTHTHTLMQICQPLAGNWTLTPIHTCTLNIWSKWHAHQQTKYFHIHGLTCTCAEYHANLFFITMPSAPLAHNAFLTHAWAAIGWCLTCKTHKYAWKQQCSSRLSQDWGSHVERVDLILIHWREQK